MDALPARIRAFVALRLAAEVEQAIDAFVATQRPGGAGMNWVARERLHLTLRFLGGAIDSNLIAPLGAALAQIAAETAPFGINARGTGAFPNLERPRVLWVGLAGAELKPLAQRVEAAAVRCGFAPEPRPYSPHLTIARVRNLRGWRELKRDLTAAADRDFGQSRIDSMALYRSILGAGAVTYRELARYAFGRVTSPID